MLQELWDKVEQRRVRQKGHILFVAPENPDSFRRQGPDDHARGLRMLRGA